MRPSQYLVAMHAKRSLPFFRLKFKTKKNQRYRWFFKCYLLVTYLIRAATCLGVRHNLRGHLTARLLLNLLDQK